MRNENLKPKIGKRLFAMLLALVMVLGLVDGIPALADDSTIETVTFSGINTNDGDYTGARVRLISNTAYATSKYKDWKDYTADTSKDADSGIWRGETLVTGGSLYWAGGTDFRVKFGAATNDTSTYATAGEEVTIKGIFTYTDTSTSTSYSFRVEEISFKYDGAAWSIVAEEEEETVIETVTFSGFNTNDGDYTGARVRLISNTAYSTDKYKDWKDYTADTSKDADSGIWRGETLVTGGSLYWAGGTDFRVKFGATTNDTSTYATAGEEVTIKGVFTYTDTSTSTSYSFGVEETTFRYNGTTWEFVIEQVAHDVAVKEIATGSATQVWFTSLETYTEYFVEGTTNTKNTWKDYKADTEQDAESGIWRNDILVEDGSLYWAGGQNFRIKIGSTEATAGDTVTIRGVFEYIYEATVPADSISYSFRIEETKFCFNGTNWEVVEEEEIIPTIAFDTTSAADFATNMQKFVYLQSSEDYAADVLPHDNWEAYKPNTEKDAESGIWRGETPITNGAIQKVSIRRFRLNFGATDDTLATVGEKVTIKGVFTYTDTSTLTSYSFRVEETTFRFNGTTWDIVIEEVAHDVAVKEIAQGSATQVYFTSVDTYIEYFVEGSTSITKNTWKDYKADTEQDAKSGIWRNNTLVTDGSLYWAGGRNFRIKLGETPATSGEIVTIRGVFEYTYKASVPKDSISYSFRIEETTFRYNGSNWEIVDKQGDYNSDYVVDIRDLVRLKKYIANPDTVQIATDATYNQDGVINYEDVDDLRWALVAGYSYDVATGIPLGLPVYSNSKTLERMAYSAPQVGTITDNVFTPYSDADIDVALQEYKAAGFTLISSAGVASYPSSKTGADYEARISALETLMKAADRNDLKVLVHLNYINDLRYQYLLDYDVSNIAYANVIKSHATAAAQYSAFAGFIVGDEWTACEAELYQEIITILKNVEAEMKAAGTLKEDMIITTSQYPVSTFDEETITLFSNTTNANFTKTGVEVLTGDANSTASKDEAYKTYLSKFTGNGMFTFDLYPLSWRWFDGLYVNEDWFDNLKYVANTGLSKTGVTIQSCQIGSGNIYYRYAPEKNEDISFQMYTALAYGMKSINYYCYNASSDSDIVDYITKNENIYNAVKAANAELELFDNVLMNFKWKGALDLQASETGVGTAANSERLASAVLGNSSARTIIGCMKDIYGFDGYMVANAAGPRTSTSSEVTLTFNNADKVIVYENGVPTTKELNNGAITISVSVGEGVFVIPVKNN